MSEEARNQFQDFRNSKQGIATAVGLVVCIAYGLVARNDLLFGLVMATVYGSGLYAGKRIQAKLVERDQGDSLPAKIIAAIAVSIVASLIIAIVQGSGAVTPMADDNIIVQIIKLFFDNTASTALGIGALVGIYLHGMDAD